MTSSMPLDDKPAAIQEGSQAESRPIGRSIGDAPAGGTGRLLGIDLARALAVFGMFIVHIGPPLSATDGVGSGIRYLADGHSSVLFATLAGSSLALLSGGRHPKEGLAGRQATLRIAIRAVVLLGLGTVLAMQFGGVIILGFYGVYFLLALPLVRMSAKTVGILAAATAVVGPQLAFALNALLPPAVLDGISAVDPLKQLSEVGIVELLLNGFYPAITWMPFVLAGMALGRLDLRSGVVRLRVAIVGSAVTVVAYGASLLLAGKNALASLAEGGEMPDGAGSLLLAGPHSGTTFDIVGSTGVAMLVIVAATELVERLTWLRRLAAPVIAVGAMSLTAYVGPFVLQPLLLSPAGEEPQQSWVPVILFILGTIVFAAIWSRFFRRGPLEYLLHVATMPASRLR
ncbi:DUF418 domain-containing protein [Microbacterium sp. 22303]|uniref:DUF418 domain-containing protein n=1 Tax=Microbacterium sp. 22303 TaxID=3453905 RepID=UPI003F84A33B